MQIVPSPASGLSKTVEPAKAVIQEIQLPLDQEELLTLMQDSLETLATELGVLVVFDLMEDEVTRLSGRRPTSACPKHINVICWVCQIPCQATASAFRCGRICRHG